MVNRIAAAAPSWCSNNLRNRADVPLLVWVAIV
jgi:hypothetical protein